MATTKTSYPAIRIMGRLPLCPALCPPLYRLFWPFVWQTIRKSWRQSGGQSGLPISSCAIMRIAACYPVRSVRSVQPLSFLLSGLLFCCLAAALSAYASDEPHFGPLLERFDLTLSPGHRTEGFGPFSYHELKDTQETYAVPPLFAHVEDPATDSEELDA